MKDSWSNLTERLVNAIPHPIAVGCIAIALGALVFALAAPAKSKLDQTRRSKRDGKKARVTRLRMFYVILLLAGVVLTAVGTGLTINGGQITAMVQAKQAQLLLDQTRQENERANKEYEANCKPSFLL